MKIPFGAMTITQTAKDLIAEALDSERLSSGKLVRRLEERFAKLTGAKEAVAVSSGTDADALALAVLHDFGASRGDEVIVPALSFVATGNAVLQAGFEPVFVDIERHTLNIDPTRIESAITDRTVATIAPTDGRPGPDRAWLCERADRRLFFGFLLCAALLSYGVHVGYTVKSDHMTRATAAPLFVMVLMVLIPWLSRTVLSGARGRIAAGGAVTVAVLAGLAMQMAFYTSPARGQGHRSEMPALTRLFDNLSEIADEQKMDSLAISVDTVESFSLGNMMIYSSYAYEHDGVLRKIHPKLGFPIEEGVSKDKALSLLAASDIVLLTRGEPPPGWGLTESLRPFRKEIREFVSKTFVHHSTYFLYGMHRDLYYRRAWKIMASASTVPKFGPERLLSDVGQIWHAPWHGKHPQWVILQSPEPVILEDVLITAQDGGPDRAPRAFVFQASDDGETWTDLLNVNDAEFSLEKMSLEWPVQQDKPHRWFRLWITENCGHPTLLTIQSMRLTSKAETSD